MLSHSQAQSEKDKLKVMEMQILQMVNDNDTILIRTLNESYQSQLELYNGMRTIVRQLMSRLVLSRGDLAQLAESLQKKMQFLAAIEKERTRIAEYVETWQSRKNSVPASAETDELNETLQKVSDAIQAFLHDEAQLQTYLQGVMSRTRPV